MRFYPEDYDDDETVPSFDKPLETWDPEELLYASTLLDFHLWCDELMDVRSISLTWMTYEAACKAREGR
jgi:hypothetical protein